MRSSSTALVLTAAALAGTGVVVAQSRPSPGTMSVDEVRPGMTGYGLTVFHGTQPERFAVEVLDVLHQARPGMDMVLIRTTHPLLDHAGTVAGMSGSPIYINDRLIGAYAYGWEFGRDPIAGVTPIANMLAEEHRTRRTPDGLIPGSQIPLPIAPPRNENERGHRRSEWDVLSSQMVATRAPVNTEYGAMAPLSVPLAIAGMSDGAFQQLSRELAPMGIVALQAGGTGRGHANPPNPSRYVNGGSISVTLIDGDISAAATGTVTLADGNDVLAFGHPMMGFGEVTLPAALSRVAWILASDRRSHKMAEPIAPLGALEQDRPFGIYIDEHATAPMLPMHVRVNGNPGAVRNEWSVRIAYHRALLARLYGAVIGSALETTSGDVADAAWVVRSDVQTRDHGVLHFVDYGASSEGTNALQTSQIAATEAVERLTDNAFEQVRVDRIEVNVDLRWRREFYLVRSVALSRAEANPGDTVNLLVTLGQYGGPPAVRSIPITIPREVAGRDVDIDVSAGGDTMPDLPEPESIDDLIRNLTTSFPDDSLVVSLRMPGQGVMLRGRVVPNLPSSALDTLRPAASTDGGEPILNVQRSVVPLDRLVIGHDRVRIHVRDVRE